MFKDVPRYMVFILKATHGDLALAQIQGLSLTVHKLITDVCGNAAYSGYFGYMVGLAAMKPKSRWRIWASDICFRPHCTPCGPLPGTPPMAC